MKTEWKVKLASLGAFVGSLAASIALDAYTPAVIEHAPEGLRFIVAGLVASAASWLSGYVARTRPESVSQSTIDAVLRHRQIGQ